MQLLVKGTRRIIFILCAVSDAKRYYSSPLKLATLQTSLKHVRRSAHNADFCRFIAVLVNNAFKTVQQSAKDKEDICRRANARQRYLTQDFTL